MLNMRIEIDTKEDLHNIRHIMRLLQAISVNAGNSKEYVDSNMFSESSSLSSSSNHTPPAEGPGLFNMFGDSSSSSSTDSMTTPSIFQEKKDDNSKDFLDSLQVY